MPYIEFGQESCIFGARSFRIPIPCGGLLDQHGDFEEAGNYVTSTLR